MDQQLFNFSEAISQALDFKKISRKEWKDIRHYGLIKDGLLQIHKAGEDEKTIHPWILNDGDLLGEDWIVV